MFFSFKNSSVPKLRYVSPSGSQNAENWRKTNKYYDK